MAKRAFACFTLVLLLLCTACTPTLTALHPGTLKRPRVEKLYIGIANVYVVYGERPILIDVGTHESYEELRESLKALEIERGKLALAILTHGHADHAGASKALHEDWKVPVAMGAADTGMALAGHNTPLKSTSAMASVLKPFIRKSYPPFKPDVVIADKLDLRSYGVAGEAMVVPGHTGGSVVVLLEDGDAFVGDLFAGGRLGGKIKPTRPQSHYYHDDQEAAEAAVCDVIKRGAKRLYLGHGGPVAAPRAWDRFCALQKR